MNDVGKGAGKGDGSPPGLVGVLVFVGTGVPMMDAAGLTDASSPMVS